MNRGCFHFNTVVITENGRKSSNCWSGSSLSSWRAQSRIFGILWQGERTTLCGHFCHATVNHFILRFLFLQFSFSSSSYFLNLPLPYRLHLLNAEAPTLKAFLIMQVSWKRYCRVWGKAAKPSSIRWHTNTYFDCENFIIPLFLLYVAFTADSFSGQRNTNLSALRRLTSNTKPSNIFVASSKA